MQINLPDEVVVEIPLEHMEVKDSLFIPTLRIEDTRILVHRLACELEIKVTTKTAIVDGYLGLMVWRVS